MNFQDLLEDCKKAASWINSQSEVIRILSTSEVDSMIGAAIFTKSLFQIGKPCQTSIHDIHDIQNKENSIVGPTIFIGINPENLKIEFNDASTLFILNEAVDELESSEMRVLCNGFTFEDNNNIAIISSMSYFISSSIVENLDYLVKLPIISAYTTDNFDLEKGLIKYILEDALSGDTINIIKQLRINGSYLFSIDEALLYCNFPFLPGISGNIAAVDKLLARADIEVELGDQKRKLGDLSKEEVTKLNNSIILHLSTQTGYQEEGLVFIKPNIQFLDENHESIVGNSFDFVTAVKDAANRRDYATAMAVLIGDRSSNLVKLRKMFLEERKAVAISFQLLVDKKDDIIELSRIRYFNSDRKVNWYNSSITAAIALSNGLVTPDLPFAVVSPGPENHETVGIRASKTIFKDNEFSEIILEVQKQFKNIHSFSISKLSAQFSFEQNKSEEFLLQLNEKLKEIFPE